MQTQLNTEFLDTPAGREADAILRSCVHCGFCTATCPTYQLLGDELDGPRGRIYLIKQMLEDKAVSRETQLHLDRCLTCRSCETTCPSGVRYGRLVDIGRNAIEQRVTRPFGERLLRRGLRFIVPYANRFGLLLRIGQALRAFLPTGLQRKLPAAQVAGAWPATRHTRRMLVLEGCAQKGATPRTNAATARVLDRLGISLVRAANAGCCGALSQHLSAEREALDFMRRNIDAWWPYVEAGVEAIVSTASGCGVMIKEYGHALQHDPGYADKALRIAALARDLSEVIPADAAQKLGMSGINQRIAFHAPCTLQHGQQLHGHVEALLSRIGYILLPVSDSHLCCGSAGTYSVLQSELATRLRDDKLTALTRESPSLIATANVGCQLHLATAAGIPVVHWIELLDRPV